MASNGQHLNFALHAEGLENRLKAALAKEMEKVKAMNLPIIFRNELCVKPNMFIHKYPDGRTLLVEQNSTNPEEKIIRIL